MHMREGQTCQNANQAHLAEVDELQAVHNRGAFCGRQPRLLGGPGAAPARLPGGSGGPGGWGGCLHMETLKRIMLARPLCKFSTAMLPVHHDLYSRERHFHSPATSLSALLCASRRLQRPALYKYVLLQALGTHRTACSAAVLANGKWQMAGHTGIDSPWSAMETGPGE
jgi:hypothetical protein